MDRTLEVCPIARKNAKGLDYYAFNRLINCPSIICEGLFVDNATDVLIGDTPAEQRQFGIAYAKAILKQLGATKINSIPTPVTNSRPVTSTASNNWVAQLQAECNNQDFSSQEVDGVPGPITLRGCPLMKLGVSGKITKILQTRLISLGYSCGRWGADGDFGASTRTAVIAFQKAHGLVPDGVVGQKTWKKLLCL